MKKATLNHTAVELATLTAKAKELAKASNVFSKFSNANQLLIWYYTNCENASSLLLSYVEWDKLGYKVKSESTRKFALWRVPELYKQGKNYKQTQCNEKACLEDAKGRKLSTYIHVWERENVQYKQD